MPRFAFQPPERHPRRSAAGPADLAAQDLFDVNTTPVSHAHATPASHEAADQAYLRSYPNALRSLELLSTAGPMTSNRCAQCLGLDDQAIRPRFTQMKDRGWILALKLTAPSGHGGRAHLHEITDAGRAILQLLRPQRTESVA